MTIVKLPTAMVCTFLWIGFVCAISFMEAWLKFRAPGITLPLGLGIGRLVFNALNKVEIVLALVIIINIFWSSTKVLQWNNVLILIPVILLVIQTIWLLPSLDARAEMHIKGDLVPPSNLHFFYVGVEFIKVICLIIFGITLFKSQTN